MLSISFQIFFVQAFKIFRDSWKFSMLLLYLWDDWPIFMIAGSNEQLQQQFEYTLLKPDCHSWWISKMLSGLEDTLEEQYAIKLCFKLGKIATETYALLQTEFPVEACWLSQENLRGCRYETVEEMLRLWRRSLTRSHKRTSMGPSRCFWNDTTSVLQLEEITSMGTWVSFVYYQ